MEYRQRSSLPPHCEACGETSEAMCFICNHFHDKYVLADEKAVLDQVRRRLIRKLLQVDSELDYYVIRWKPITQRPANYSYVLIEELDDELGTISCSASYEKGRFWYFNPGSGDIPVEETRIIGWDYFPYDHHKEEEHADQVLDAIFGNLKQFIRDEIERTLEEPDADRK